MTDSPLLAYHGDSWLSPTWAIVINGESVDPAEWHIRAQVRKNAAAPEALLSWETPSTDILLGSATVATTAGPQLQTGTVQLRIRPTTWTGVPGGWTGLLDIELSSDATDDPDYRYTVVRRRSFQVISDVAS